MRMSFEKRHGHPNKRKIKGVRRDRKAQRRIEAEARNAAWHKLTPEQQLVELAMRPGTSWKQTARIVEAMV